MKKDGEGNVHSSCESEDKWKIVMLNREV